MIYILLVYKETAEVNTKFEVRSHNRDFLVDGSVLAELLVSPSNNKTSAFLTYLR